MKTLIKLLSLSLCVIICLSFITTVSATTETPKITITSTDAMPGDSVTINIDITNNPGIMAMAFCITYDKDALVYKNYSKGYLSSYTVKDHSDKGHVSFVNVENKNITSDGTIISILFEVKKESKPGKHVITLANSNREKHGTKLHNSFSNSKQEFVLPFVTSGGVTVQETCENSGHKFDEWNIIREASCTISGLKEHTCLRCNTTQEEIIPITHDFEADWTVDKAATPEEDGLMSRHCTKCDAVTDEIKFKYEEIVEDDTPNDETPDDTSSDENTSQESNLTSSEPESRPSDTSSETTTTPKPNINNVVGEKVPLQEAEKFEDYQQTIKPSLDNNNSSTNTSSMNTSSSESSSKVESNSSNTTIGAINSDSTDTPDEETSFFSTTGGIITIILCALLSIGIIVLAIMLLLRNKKSN